MLIDSHTHIFPFGLVNQDLTDWFKKTYNLENFKFGIKELINEMDVNSVEKSIVLPLIKENEFEMINNYMGKIQKKWTDRILCFGTINPKDTKSSLIELKKIKRNLNLKGIKLHPTIQQFYPNEEKFFKIYELAEKLDLPILFHSGFSGLPKLFDKYSEPILLDDVASRFNNLKIIIAHGGRFFFDQTAMLLRKHKNIFTEISSNFPKIPINGKNNNLLLIELLKKIKILNGNLKKVFFGSDFPFRGINKTLNLLNSIKSDRSQEINFFPKEIDEILNENLINNLGHVFRLT